MYQSIESSEDIHTYQVVWDKEWNCYPDTGELEKNGKKLAYAGEIMTGMKDQMKEIQWSFLIMELQLTMEVKFSIFLQNNM